METLKKYYMTVENRTGVWLENDEIAYLSDKSGVIQVWKMSIHDKKPIQLTHYTERIWRLEAAANHRDILFSTDLGGNEQEQLFLLKAGEREAVDLCQDGTTRFNLGGTNAQSDTVYFTCNRRSKANFDICKMNMQTREIVTVLESRDNMNMPASVSPDGRYMLINKLKGMSNLETFLENTAPYRRSHREGEYGSLEKHRDVLRKVSPIHVAHRITAPLMVIHGANDPRVPVSEAEQLVENLRSRDVSVKYLCYMDEGHGIMKLANKLDCYPQVVQFLKTHLG